MTATVSTPDKQSHLWKKGYCPNPAGRPVGSHDTRLQLLKALAKIEKEQGLTFAEHFVNEAFKSDARNPQLMVAMARKLWPDLTSETGDRGPQVIQIVYSYASAPSANQASPSSGEGGVSPSVNRVADFVNGNASEGSAQNCKNLQDVFEKVSVGEKG